MNHKIVIQDHGVDVSRDLGHARVHLTVLGADSGEEAEQSIAALNKAAGFLRSKLGRAIKVRHLPELRFVHDDSAAEAVRISELIDSATDEHGAADHDDSH